MPRLAPPPDEVIARIHDAGGIASLAHPGLLERDEWIAGFAAAGLDALEAYHTDHDARSDGALPHDGGTVWAWPSPAAPTITPTSRTARQPGQRVAAAGTSTERFGRLKRDAQLGCRAASVS